MAIVQGTVFQDLNFDLLFNPGDVPLGGVTVFDDSNNNNIFDPGEPFAISELDPNAATGAGVYSLTVPDGSSPLVSVDLSTLPPGLVPTNTPNLLPFIAAGDPPFDFNVSNVLPPVSPPPVIPGGFGVISGTVFIDLNNDGLFDPVVPPTDLEGEPTSSGVEVFIDLNNDGIRQGNEPLTVSDNDGFYDFEVPPGVYVLRFNPEGGFEATTDNPAIVEVFPNTITYVLNGQVIPNSIYGFVINDLNGNGIPEPNEPGFAGVEVMAGGESAITDADGFYLIDGLDIEIPGANDPQNPFEQFIAENDPSSFSRTFTVEFVNPSGALVDINGVVVPSPFGFTSPVVDEDSLNALTTVVVTSGGSAQANATIVPPVLTPPVPVADSLTGFLFEDSNGNSAFDLGETAGAGAGATVFIDSNGSGVLDPGEPEATADSDGIFGFFNLNSTNPGVTSYPVRVQGLEGSLSAGAPTGAAFVYTTPVLDVSSTTVGAGASVAIGFFDTNGGTLTPASIVDDAFPVLI